MPERPDLSVVIPVHNAASTIGAVINAFTSIQTLAVEVIAVDDASQDESPRILAAAADASGVTVRSLELNRGAGIARNLGFDGASGRYTLFFDADDEVHPDALARGIDVLDRSEADAAVMAYRYRRGALDHDAEMNGFDVAVWADYTRGRDVRVAKLDEIPRLLGTSNYPWNKIVRTDRYRATGLRFGSTPVNNDILGHWRVLLGARRIALLREPLCTHVVAAGNPNLTNRNSRVRLTLFDALDETYDYLESLPHLRRRYAHHYWDLVLRVSDWASAQLETAVRDEFRSRLQRHLLRVNLADYNGIRTRRSPGLANRILARALS